MTNVGSDWDSVRRKLLSESGFTYAAALIIGLVFALYLLPLDFIAGVGPAWREPHKDLVTPNGADHMHAITGMRYFLADKWRLPLFKTLGAGGDEGFNIIFTDSIPLVALVMKLFGVQFQDGNYFGSWLFLCFPLQGVGAVYLVRSFDIRSPSIGVAAAIIALTFPPLLFRFGHSSLVGQFFLLFALGQYFRSVRRNDYLRRWPWFAALLILVLLVHAYLFVMCFGIFLAASVQHAAQTHRHLMEASIRVGGVALSLAGVMWVSGYFISMVTVWAIGHNSMNLLSPWIPQMSGLFPSADSVIDATGGQYEGFNYFGVGVLLLLAAALVLTYRDVIPVTRKYWALALVLIGFTALSLGNRIFLGRWEILDIYWTADLVKTFRSSGRFFWPTAYSFLAFGIVAVTLRAPRRIAYAVIGVCAILQFVDARLLISEIRMSARTGGDAAIVSTPWQDLIAEHQQLTVVPSFFCAGSAYLLVAELGFRASKSLTPINTVYLDRVPPTVHCSAEVTGLQAMALRPDELLVILSPPVGLSDAMALPGFSKNCRRFAQGFACSRQWEKEKIPQVESYFSPIVPKGDSG